MEDSEYSSSHEGDSSHITSSGSSEEDEGFLDWLGSVFDGEEDIFVDGEDGEYYFNPFNLKKETKSETNSEPSE